MNRYVWWAPTEFCCWKFYLSNVLSKYLDNIHFDWFEDVQMRKSIAYTQSTKVHINQRIHVNAILFKILILWEKIQFQMVHLNKIDGMPWCWRVNDQNHNNFSCLFTFLPWWHLSSKAKSSHLSNDVHTHKAICIEHLIWTVVVSSRKIMLRHYPRLIFMSSKIHLFPPRRKCFKLKLLLKLDFLYSFCLKSREIT